MPNWKLFIPSTDDLKSPTAWTWMVIGLVIGGILF